ncbi:DUF3093 domain-containing protein [Corynebacterium kalidii]|uniref:DUF3093 domain-containing protein n=1 Tax=Corynebacterium kalidii TaxID=2931982 RepID=A0A9X1WJ92_9CORY|nr:DUF3093 domain-containing protein [Corynebacterium kalidii]
MSEPELTGDDVPQDPGGTRPGTTGPAVLYRERQRVPMSWWLIGLGLSTLVGFQGQMSREWYWGLGIGLLVLAAVVWALLHLSSNELVVERDADGETWLRAGEASLPTSVVSRSLAVPPTARSAAMGRQLDPAAFVYHRPWIPSMAMLVLDDPDDPTPYWLVSTNEPEQLLTALGTPQV